MAKFNVCATCGAEAPEGEEPQHYADCPKHPNNLAVNRVQQIRNTGGNTKDFQAELAARDEPTYKEYDRTPPPGFDIKNQTTALLYTSGSGKSLAGSAELRLSKELMEEAMALFLKTQFSLSSVKVEKVTGNSSKGFLVKFRGDEQ